MDRGGEMDDGGCSWLLAERLHCFGYVCWCVNRDCEESETGRSNAAIEKDASICGWAADDGSVVDR